MSNVIPLFKRQEHKKSTRNVSTCGKCGRKVKRSHVTGILHSNCFRCRYLIMVYGPSIGVRLVP